MALYFEMRKRQEFLKKKKNEAPFLVAEDSSSENELENANQNNSMSDEEEVSKSSPVREVDILGEHDDDVNSFDTSAGMEHEVAAEKDIAASAKASSKVAGEKKHRGPTDMAAVHNRKFDERPIIILNEEGQPIGPTPAVVSEFSRFLGTMARDSKLAPLNYVTWYKVPKAK
ncbi:unnamed protein product, partial [Cuscuta epithymum]